ncbi:methyltransferase FkbM [Parafrankia soli]|uniref:Methyltransferase FkbM n=1 Tax=Parafrankia soli TaxID=2599596 RepID=A0A1S1PGS4_9ACTN|nr:methyltransferase FkbM [Parafrankia soli]
MLRRRLPPPFERTRIYTSSEGGLKYIRRSLADVDPALVSFVQEQVRPGHIVWDVGANLGLFTFAAAEIAGPGGAVVAIEPDTWLVDLLRRSLRIPNDRAPVDVLPAAVGESTGVGRFCVATRNRATSHLHGFGTTQTGGVRSVETVPVFRLDDLLAHFPPPDVVKIDVEGAEVTVLTGAHRMLRQVRPVILCEVVTRNAAAVAKTLHNAGYQVLDASLPPSGRRPLAGAPFSTLAVPADDGGAGSTERGREAEAPVAATSGGRSA